jgi:hypothetical protein
MPFPRPHKPKTCLKCGKEYMPNAFNQKFCPLCSTRYNPSKSKNRCSVCGRATSGYSLPAYPNQVFCSFCLRAKNNQEAEKRLAEKNGLNHCHECGRTIYGNSKSLSVLLKFRLCVMCFYAKNPIPECPKCGKVSRDGRHYTVRLSDQEAPTFDKVVWYCEKCDFVFTTLVRL